MINSTIGGVLGFIVFLLDIWAIVNVSWEEISGVIF